MREKFTENQNTINSDSAKSKRDGNVAFKVTYTDSNWSGVCSPEVAAYYFQERRWCGIQKDRTINCQSEIYADPQDVSFNNAPCHDCIAQKELFFYAGHYHGDEHENEPIKCLHAKKGKIAVFTSRENGEPEDERFIFSIGQINEFREVQDINGNYECYFCDNETALIFNTNLPKFWKYYSNANNPDREAWNTGLFRYLDDELVAGLLKDISSLNRYPNKEKKKAEYLLGQL